MLQRDSRPPSDRNSTRRHGEQPLPSDDEARTATMTQDGPALEVVELEKNFIHRHPFGRSSVIRAVDDLSFAVPRASSFGLVGESGCGKTTTGRLIARLLEPTDGMVKFDGQDIAHLRGSELKNMRQNIQMVFQDPYSSLNPRHTVGRIIATPLIAQGRLRGAATKMKVIELLRMVGLSPDHLNRYPHEFSGGQRQRVGIARALALEPKVVICDEPVAALDVSIQAQVLNLLQQLQRDLGLSLVFISHDLSVVRHICDQVAVMYLGKIVEIGHRDSVFNEALHPYTHALLSAVPVPDPVVERRRKRIVLEGDLPSPTSPPSGCRFRTRCWRAESICSQEEPPLESRGTSSHRVACHFPNTFDTSSPGVGI